MVEGADTPPAAFANRLRCPGPRPPQWTAMLDAAARCEVNLASRTSSNRSRVKRRSIGSAPADNLGHARPNRHPGSRSSSYARRAEIDPCRRCAVVHDPNAVRRVGKRDTLRTGRHVDVDGRTRVRAKRLHVCLRGNLPRTRGLAWPSRFGRVCCSRGAGKAGGLSKRKTPDTLAGRDVHHSD